MELLPLHKTQNLMQDCISILNKEWPRSHGARVYSLEKSCDSFPVALAFVEVTGKTVLGFSKIANVQGQQNSCLFESIIIREEDRGKGFGRILMEKTEHYARGLGVKTAYLNTTNKVGFYARLGYTKCDPVISLGANAHRVPESMLKHFIVSSEKKTEPPCNELDKLKVNGESLSPPQTSSRQPNHQQSEPPSQPTPPPPPPPPLPPPAPSSLPPPSSSSTTSNKATTPVRLDPSQVTWMKKEL